MSSSLSRRMDQASLAAIALVLLAGLALMAAVDLFYGQPTGVDYAFHIRHAERYARGELALFEPALLAVNQGPYPPLFHLLLAGFEVLNLRAFGGLALQLLLYPLMLASTAVLVHRVAGLRAAGFTLALLAGSVAFVDRAQVIPEALDGILFPLAALAFLEDRPKALAILLALAVWNHGAYALLFGGALFLLALVRRSNLPAVGWGLAAGSPIAGLTLAFLPTELNYAGADHTLVETIIRKKPVVLLGNLGLGIVLALPLALVWLAWAWRNRRLPARWAGLGLVCGVWALALLPLLYFFPDRFASYAATPLAVLSGLWLARMSELDERAGLFILAGLLAFALVLNFGMWWQLTWNGQLVTAAP